MRYDSQQHVGLIYCSIMGIKQYNKNVSPLKIHNIKRSSVEQFPTNFKTTNIKQLSKFLLPHTRPKNVFARSIAAWEASHLHSKLVARM